MATDGQGITPEKELSALFLIDFAVPEDLSPTPLPPVEKKAPLTESKTTKVVKPPKTEPVTEQISGYERVPGLNYAAFNFYPSLNDFQDTLLKGEDSFASLEEDPDSQFYYSLGNDPEPAAVAQKPAASISYIFPSIFNEKVKEFINFFQERADSFFVKALGRSLVYEDMMKKIFREKNLPEELFYLALIESGFNPYALSRAKAGGIWQFVGRTAKRFGLKVDKWIDERRDPEKATYAAAEYLKSLYEIFNCWDLAAASYNAGEGKVLRAMKKAKSQDFWEIARYRYLKQETKRYVPMFLAAVLIAKEPDKYGFTNIAYHPPLLYEKITVPPATNLAWIAKLAETDLSEIKALNPALKRGQTPPDSLQFEIKLPPGKKAVFENNLLAQSQLALKKHRVRAGETLASIAKKYRTPLRDLCEFNGLSPNGKIKPGLTIMLPP